LASGIEIAKNKREAQAQAVLAFSLFTCLLSRTVRIRSAIEILKECVKKEPKNPAYQYLLGMSYLTSGDKATKAYLNGAFRLNPNFPGGDEARTAMQKL
jgi:tetratricopeptide (TPR) repeat protein